MKDFKKLLAIILCLVFCLSLFPSMAFAEGEQAVDESAISTDPASVSDDVVEEEMPTDDSSSPIMTAAEDGKEPVENGILTNSAEITDEVVEEDISAEDSADVIIYDDDEVIDGEEEGFFDAALGSLTIDKAVLFDQEGIRITAKGLEEDGWLGPSLKMLIENNTNRRITVQCRNASVNGYMIDTILSCDLAAGKKATDSLSFTRSSLTQAGIDIIADMEFSFHIFDSDTWNTIIDSAMISIETSAASEYEYTFDNSGDSVYNKNGLEIVVKGLSADASLFGPSMVMFLRNNTGKDITVQVRNVSINGFMVDSIFSCDLINGKCAVDTITFMSNDLEENDITEINEVELYFHVFTMEGWNTLFDTPIVRIVFPIFQKNGLVLDDDGVWRYYENGQFDSTKSGIVEYNGSRFFVANGVVASDPQYDGLQLNAEDGKWYFLAAGMVAEGYDWAAYNGFWFRLNGHGELDVNANGLYDYNGGIFLVAAGQIKTDYTGIYSENGVDYNIVNGQVWNV